MLKTWTLFFRDENTELNGRVIVRGWDALNNVKKVGSIPTGITTSNLFIFSRRNSYVKQKVKRSHRIKGTRNGRASRSHVQT